MWSPEGMITMTMDPTESVRREMLATGQPAADLAADPGEKMTTSQMLEKYTVRSFAAPFVVVVRKEDGAHGTLEFARDEAGDRYYFGWEDA